MAIPKGKKKKSLLKAKDKVVKVGISMSSY